MALSVLAHSRQAIASKVLQRHPDLQRKHGDEEALRKVHDRITRCVPVSCGSRPAPAGRALMRVLLRLQEGGCLERHVEQSRPSQVASHRSCIPKSIQGR